MQDRCQRVIDSSRIFTFSVGEGLLCGPSRGVCNAQRPDNDGEGVRVCPIGTALPDSEGYVDSVLYDPQTIEVTFLPQANRVYRSVFAIAIAGGDPLFFSCAGCGSYDDENGAIEESTVA